jgi:hypothetical protein
MDGVYWALVTVAGPLILAAAILYAVYRRRRGPTGPKLPITEGREGERRPPP